jgi:hypothetical protein
MAYRTFGALVTCLGAAALVLSVEAASARSGGAASGPSARGVSVPHAPGAQAFRHHRGGFPVGSYWPGAYAYGPYGEPASQEAPAASVSADIHSTYTYDVPWDWAHRYPPNVVPSDRPYVSSCPTETVTVPGRYGAEQTVNITRCY